MSDAYDHEQTDKAMSARLRTIFDDPARHHFTSIYDFDTDADLRGLRGGKIRGSKTICAYCGYPRLGHLTPDQPGEAL